MTEAMKDCCENVWAIVEIAGPDEGFDCNLLLDTGGTQFRSPNPHLKPSGSNADLAKKMQKNGNYSMKSGGQYKSYFESGAERNGVKSNKIWRSLIPGSGPADAVKQNKSESDDSEQAILNVVELRALMGLGPSVTVRMLP